MKTVSFIVFYHIFYFNASRFQRLYHLVGFIFVHARVVCALRNEERNFDFIRMKNR